MTPAEIRAIRERWGMSQQEFSTALGISSRERVSDMENGRRRIRPTLERLINMTDKTLKILQEAENQEEQSWSGKTY